MNADPFEHANPTVALVAWFYGNFPELANATVTARQVACPNSPLFLSDHHGHYSVYDAYLKRLR